MTVCRWKELIQSGKLMRTFALARVVHPVVVELVGLAGGFDGFWLDQEHGGVTVQDIVLASLAARANGMDSFVRVAPVGYWQVTQCLEAGAGGVMAAQIHSANAARQFVSWTKFAPQGTRGLNTGGRDADFTHMPPAQFVEQANLASFVAIQIETLGALEQVDDIAAIDGVDLLFVGPADLSLALGIVGQFEHARLWEAIQRVADACRRRGKVWGAVVPDPAFAQRALDLGCRMPTVGNDVLILRRGIEAMRQAFAGVFEFTPNAPRPTPSA